MTQWAFSSFNISEDTKLAKTLQESWIEKAIIIKRSVIFWYFISWHLLVALLLTVGNVYLLSLFLGYNNLGYIVMSIYGFCFVYWTFAALRYLIVFRGIYGKENKIKEISTLIDQLDHEDHVFESFFDQTILNYICLFGLMIFSIGILFFQKTQLDNWMYLLWIIPIIFVQFVLSKKYTKRMIDMEMDFNVIVHGKIYFYNQKTLWGTSQMMEADKIKTINSSVSGVLQSFFWYGDILVLTEGDEAQNGEMNMYFVTDPKETVLEIYRLLDGPMEVTIVTVDELLERIHKEELDTGTISPETKKEIHTFLSENDASIKELFETWDEKTKKSVKALYMHVE